MGRKILGIIPGGNKLAKYFQKYETAQTQLDKIIKSLMAGQDELLKDNAGLAQEKIQLWETMQGLSEYAVFAKALDTATAEQDRRAEASGPDRGGAASWTRTCCSRSASATRTS